ncbi:hypothetical protein [Jeotgalibacillus marinus]|uniref:Uncharacterized protein n=1 Tax=Jeotgalibacillus marinus TaxID=86667 RepID=A0ABV3Q7L3_9BACL
MTMVTRKSMLSLFSSLVMLLTVFSFNTSASANAMTDTEETPDLSNLENVDVSARFDMNTDGVQEQEVYGDDGEVIGTLRVKNLDQVASANDPTLIPLGESTFEIEFDGSSDIVNMMKFDVTVNGRESMWSWPVSEIVRADNSDYDLKKNFHSDYEEINIRNNLEHSGFTPAWARYGIIVSTTSPSSFVGYAFLDARMEYGYLTTSFAFYNLAP